MPYSKFLNRQINQYCLPWLAHCRSSWWGCGRRCEMLLLAHYCMYQLDSFLPVHPYIHQSRITGKISLQWKGFRRSDWNLHTHSSSSSAALPPFCVLVCSAYQRSHLFCEKHTLLPSHATVFVLQCIPSNWFFRSGGLQADNSAWLGQLYDQTETWYTQTSCISLFWGGL